MAWCSRQGLSLNEVGVGGRGEEFVSVGVFLRAFIQKFGSEK